MASTLSHTSGSVSSGIWKNSEVIVSTRNWHSGVFHRPFELVSGRDFWQRSPVMVRSELLNVTIVLLDCQVMVETVLGAM